MFLFFRQTLLNPENKEIGYELEKHKTGGMQTDRQTDRHAIADEMRDAIGIGLKG